MGLEKGTQAPLRLLIVDDSPYNRRLIEGLFAHRTDVVVVGAAADGEEALRLFGALEPDVITLDLEMPKMDGFTVLRILLAKRPVPIIVVSSYAQRENVFRALELGAFDFVTKATSTIDASAEELKSEILLKVLQTRGARDPRRASLRRGDESTRSLSLSAALKGAPKEAPPESKPLQVAPRRVVVIASSTGGPSALLELVAAIPQRFPHAILVAQHMPEKFTRTFAERLGRRGHLRGCEAEDGMVVCAGDILVCPGGFSMELYRDPGGTLRTRVARPTPGDRYVPSGDRLFASAAAVFAADAFAVVLTGMGDDGLAGARKVRDAGGSVVAESAETAVVDGMPGHIRANGLATLVLALPKIAAKIASLP
jgi:two-component system, chemotaxis family, protein-glutamate methylesterase/glutaminase